MRPSPSHLTKPTECVGGLALSLTHVPRSGPGTDGGFHEAAWSSEATSKWPSSSRGTREDVMEGLQALVT